MVAILMELVNFMWLLSLDQEATQFHVKERNRLKEIETITDELRLFEVWVFVEKMMIIVTVLVNIVYMFFRSLTHKADGIRPYR